MFIIYVNYCRLRKKECFSNLALRMYNASPIKLKELDSTKGVAAE